MSENIEKKVKDSPQRNLSNEDFLLIARDLELHHAVFSKIWNIGKPCFTDKLPTAAVVFDKEGNHLDFQFNPEFWDKLSPYERNFVICHECLHVILNHGFRLKELNKDFGNIAADVVINEMLVNGFGFDRSKLEWVGKNGCWLDNVFKDYTPPVDKDRSMEYYYNLLKKEMKEKIQKAIASGNFKIVDDHDGMEGIDPTDLEDVLGDVLNEMNDGEKKSLDKQLKEGNQDEVQECNKEAGTMPGNLEITVKVGFVKKKKKWETVIHRWANRFIKEDQRDHEQWARVNRRFVGITTSSGGLFLPSEMEIEDREEIKKKIKVVFFQDTSGSCYSLAERFFKAARSLPKERFDVDMYCFDTKVYATSLESGKLYGFGGTSFSILEDHVWNKICKGDITKYPKAIFVITDGYGDYITPKKPRNWYWFLDPYYTTYIDKNCNFFKLSDFE